MKAIKTKIIATIGPSTNTYDSLKKLHKAGMNVARINMSHATHTDAQNIIDLVHQINSEQSDDHGPIGLLLDTQGPEIRTGINQSDMDLTVGDIVNLTIREDLDVETSSIQINYKGLIKSVSKGSRISLDNGLINFKVLAKDKENLTCKVLDGGKLGSKRHVNLPGVRVDLPSITKKDRKDILLAIKNNVSFIALSFVRSAQDINDLRDILKKKKSSARIIAKIEKPEAILAIDEIIQNCDGLMVARGDLGVEIPCEQVPLIQKKLVFKAKKNRIPVIIATQMMESMMNSLTPSRAEVNDVANSIIDGADAVMLSGETSVGKFPVQVIKQISKIIDSVEYSSLIKVPENPPTIKTNRYITKAICYHASHMADEINAKAIMTLTNSGYTAFQISAWRPHSNILVFTSNKRILNRLSLLWGVKAFYYNKFSSTDITIEEITEIATKEGYISKGDFTISLAAMPIKAKGMVNTLRVNQVT